MSTRYWAAWMSQSTLFRTCVSCDRSLPWFRTNWPFFNLLRKNTGKILLFLVPAAAIVWRYVRKRSPFLHASLYSTSPAQLMDITIWTGGSTIKILPPKTAKLPDVWNAGSAKNYVRKGSRSAKRWNWSSHDLSNRARYSKAIPLIIYKRYCLAAILHYYHLCPVAAIL